MYSLEPLEAVTMKVAAAPETEKTMPSMLAPPFAPVIPNRVEPTSVKPERDSNGWPAVNECTS